MKNKTCNNCGVDKPIDAFDLIYYKRDFKYRLKGHCVQCRRIKDRNANRKRYNENEEYKSRVLSNNASWQKKNPEIKKEIAREWYLNNREYVLKKTREYQKTYTKTPMVKYCNNMRRRVRHFLKNQSSVTSSIREYVGCSASDFKKHIESQFTNGMSWENQGEWHIDHIIPLASANTKEDVIRLTHYTNLQPLWAVDNFRKGAKVLSNS